MSIPTGRFAERLRLAVALFPDNINQSIQSSVGVGLRFQQDGETLFKALVLLAHLLSSSQSGFDHQLDDTLQPVHSVVCVIHSALCLSLRLFKLLNRSPKLRLQ